MDRGARLVEREDLDQVTNRNRLLDHRGHDARRRHRDVHAPCGVVHPLVAGVVHARDRARHARTPSSQGTRSPGWPCRRPLRPPPRRPPRRAASRSEASSHASARSQSASGDLRHAHRAAALSMRVTVWPCSSRSRAIERPTEPAPAMTIFTSSLPSAWRPRGRAIRRRARRRPCGGSCRLDCLCGRSSGTSGRARRPPAPPWPRPGRCPRRSARRRRRAPPPPPRRRV